MGLNDAVDWRTDLGGGTTVALVQAGTFRSDAGALFGPVPRILWGKLVSAELDDEHRLLQALNCLLIETPSGRVLVETGIGERVDDKTRSIRVYEGPAIVPALETAGFDPATIDVVAMTHLHFDHAGGLLRTDGTRAFPRASIVAQRAEWTRGARRQPAPRRLVRPAGADPGARLGRRRLGRRRTRAAARRVGDPDRRSLDRPPGDRRARRWTRRADARLPRRPLHAPLGGQPAMGDRVRRLPARLGRAQGRAVPPGRGRGLDDRPLPRARAPGRPPRPRIGTGSASRPAEVARASRWGSAARSVPRRSAPAAASIR